ncbi:MAG: hypothetical protein JOY71_02685 [Acetobacteraceae bacterium]|nr:hypothetical protein [Acetobacteraceae bacterium]MBV8521032.1 hypothetical protein [Acetobacteraceae bacterium]MBV8589687.1 hypothetical protein [Acetobacteraceae bacterium]
MRRIGMAAVGAAISVLGLSVSRAAVAQPQAPGWQQTLQGLLSGNQSQDQAVREAYERGYQRGRQDEARLQQRNQRPSNQSGPGYGQGRSYPDDRDQNYPPSSGGPYYNR